MKRNPVFSDAVFTDQLRNLLKQPGTLRESRLPEQTRQPSLEGKVGTGTLVVSSAGGGTVPTVYTEQAVVWSEVLVQDEFVYELPPGWPDDNTYDGFTFDDKLLPVVGDPYIVQRRTHAYAYLTDTRKYLTHHLLVSYTRPFAVAPEPVIIPVPGGKFSPAMWGFIDPRIGASTPQAIFDLMALYGL